MKKKKSIAGKVLKTGLALGAVAGAAYMLFGPNGKKHQKKLLDWAKKIQVEVEKDTKIAKAVISKEVKKFKK